MADTYLNNVDIEKGLESVRFLKENINMNWQIEVPLLQ